MQLKFTVFLVIDRVCFYWLFVFILWLFYSIFHDPWIFHNCVWQTLISFIWKWIRPTYLSERIDKIRFLFIFFHFAINPICIRVTYFQVTYAKGCIFHVKLFTIFKKLLFHYVLSCINYFLYFLFAHHNFNHFL